jgi:hypothetical protein
MRRFVRTAPFLLALGLAGLGCAEQTRPAGLAVGVVAPELEGQDENGKTLKLSDYRGKVVMLDFWAGW